MCLETQKNNYEEFLIDSLFTLEENQTYIQKYMTKNKLVYSKKITDDINKTMDEYEIGQFLRNYNIKIKHE